MIVVQCTCNGNFSPLPLYIPIVYPEYLHSKTTAQLLIQTKDNGNPVQQHVKLGRSEGLN